MRLTDVIEVLHSFQFFELARHWVAGFMRLLAWVLFLEHLDTLVFLKLFELHWEHLK